MQASSSTNYSGLSLTDLYAMIKQREEVLDETYGSTICSILGCNAIDQIPVVKASQLGLDGKTKYYQNCAKPSAMGDENLARGVAGGNRPFIAMKCELLDKNQKKITEVVEVIYKRYGLGGDGGKGKLCENNIVTLQATVGSDGVKYPDSAFYYGGGTDLKLFKNVLDGETVKDRSHGSQVAWIKLATKGSSK